MCIICRDPSAIHPVGVDAEGNDKPVLDLAGIITQLTTRWTSNTGTTRTWQTDQIVFSIPDVAPDRSNVESPGYVPMSELMKQRAREAFQLWGDLIAVPVVESSTTSSPITFAYSGTTDGDGTYARMFTFSSPSNDKPLAFVRIWMSNNWSSHNSDAVMTLGRYGFLTYLHEIGHALGLSHPGTYNAGGGQTFNFTNHAEYSQDTRQYSIMSYFQAGSNGETVDHFGSTGAFRYGSTPLLHDVLAIQAKYGANMTTRTGDTVYGFNSNAGRDVFDFTKNVDPIVTIWDAGGNDTIDVSGWSMNQRVDLREGAFSDVGHMTKNLSIAYGAVIENAIGGGGNDVLIGNAAANRLEGGDGNDHLQGLEGDDVLVGGAGADILDGGEGFDTADYSAVARGISINLQTGVHTRHAQGDTFISIERWVLTGGDDTFVGTDAAEHVEGGRGKDRLQGGGGNDVLVGGGGADVLRGGAGADVLDGGDGRDTADYRDAATRITINLQTGVHTGDAEGDTFISIERWILGSRNDTFIGSDAAEEVLGGRGADRLEGNDGDDRLYGEGGNDTLLGGRGRDQLFGGDGDDLLDGGDNADVLWGGRGNDVLTGGNGNDRFVFENEAGNDVITDFRPGREIIEFNNVTGVTAFEHLTIVDGPNGGAVITWGEAGSSIALFGVSASQLTAGDFAFVTADPAAAKAPKASKAQNAPAQPVVVEQALESPIGPQPWTAPTGFGGVEIEEALEGPAGRVTAATLQFGAEEIEEAVELPLLFDPATVRAPVAEALEPGLVYGWAGVLWSGGLGLPGGFGGQDPWGLQDFAVIAPSVSRDYDWAA